MNIITQFFRKSQQDINNYISILNNLINKHNISKVYVFSDVSVSTPINSNRKIIYINQNSKITWEKSFNFIKENEFLNKEGCFILEPGKETNFKFNQIGVHIISNAVFVKSIKKQYPIRRKIFEDYEFLRLNIIGDKFRVAAISHIYYEDLLDEVIEKHSNLYKIDYNVDYYFTLTNGSSSIGQKEWVKKKLKDKFPKCMIFELPNKGLDIGPFFKVLEYIISNNIQYDYIIKTHTKKSTITSGKYFGDIWRKTLLNILDDSRLDKIDKLLEQGALMISSGKWIVSIDKDNFNKKSLNKIKTELNITKSSGGSFVGGTMFWVKFSLIKKYLSLPVIKKYYKNMEDGYFYQINKGDQEYLTHTFERIFGLMVGNENQKIEPI